MINQTKVSLRGLRTFCVAAGYESFRSASEALFITPSAVSQQIKALEEELGEPLFERSGRSLSLTEAGRSLYEDVHPLIEQIDAITARYKLGNPRSLVRISVQPFFASEYFVPRLRAFTEEHPDIEIQVGTSDESAEKHPANTDLSIRLFRAPPANLPSDLLFPLRLVPAGSPEFVRKVKVKKSAIQGDFTVIVHESHPKAWEQWVEETGIGLPADTKVIRLDSMIAVARAAERGIGAALVPVPLGERWFESGSLVKLFDNELCTDVSYYLVCQEDRGGDESVAVLRDWVLKTFAEPAGAATR